MIAALLLALQVKAAPVAGDVLAPFSLSTLQSQPFRWHVGRATVLSFSAFWCDTWKDQLPRVDQARKAAQGLPVDFLTISVDGRWTDRGKNASIGTMLGDPGGQWSRGIGIDRVPYTLVTDPRGKIVWASYGTVRSQDLTHAIRRAVQPSADGGTIYLTFDDFPSTNLSDELLDELRKDDVKATFFCIGVNAQRLPRITKRAAQEGQSLQIHAWTHDAKNPELSKCETLLESLGAKPELYRSPGSEKICDLQGHPLDLQIVDPYDFSRPGPQELTRRILLQARANSVIQLHAGVTDTLAVLPDIIAKLKRRGFKFETLATWHGSPTRGVGGF